MPAAAPSTPGGGFGEGGGAGADGGNGPRPTVALHAQSIRLFASFAAPSASAASSAAASYSYSGSGGGDGDGGDSRQPSDGPARAVTAWGSEPTLATFGLGADLDPYARGYAMRAPSHGKHGAVGGSAPLLQPSGGSGRRDGEAGEAGEGEGEGARSGSGAVVGGSAPQLPGAPPAAAAADGGNAFPTSTGPGPWSRRHERERRNLQWRQDRSGTASTEEQLQRAAARHRRRTGLPASHSTPALGPRGAKQWPSTS
jgi:hypothetical protein